jgi:ABC-type sulfate transport system permease subunit
MWIATGTKRSEACEQKRREKLKLLSKQGKWYRNPVIIAALINAVAIILAALMSWFLNSHSQGAPLQKNVSISTDVETKGNLSLSVVTSGPSSPVNIYIAPIQ